MCSQDKEEGERVRSAVEIRKLRSGKGYFSQRAMVEALREKGIKTTHQTYSKKENGITPFTAKEIRALVEILDLSAEEGLEFFS